jgi:hypothetical protein
MPPWYPAGGKLGVQKWQFGSNNPKSNFKSWEKSNQGGMMFFKYMKKLMIVVMATYISASCDDGGDGGRNETLKNDSFLFNPVFRGGSKPDDAVIGTPVPAHDLKAESVPGRGVKLSWKFPKSYRSTKIGWRVFRKTPLSLADYSWDFNDTINDDWLFVIGTLPAKDCRDDGYCALIDPVGGPADVTYAVISYWDVEDTKSEKSVHVSAQTTSPGVINDLVFPKTFTDKDPFQTFGDIVNDVDRTTKNYLLGDKKVPWFLLDPSLSVENSRKDLRLASPLVAGIDKKTSLDLMMPDPGNFRAVKFSKGDFSECEAISEKFRGTCQQLVLTRYFLSQRTLGQKSVNNGLDIESNKDLPDSRKFSSRASSILYSKGGTRYFFVADEARILVRRDDVYGCESDVGEEGDTLFGAEGRCGFSNSVGTFSPRLRCPFRSDGSLAVGEITCSSSDMEKSMADATKPSDSSLRRPGLPIIVGDHLYIPDAGNSRLLRLSNFEEKFKRCGRLLKPGSTEHNETCKFDLVVGQASADAKNPDDSSRFSRRNCLRGGERGGKDGTSILPETAVFSDPATSGGSGGAACRMDMLTETVGSAPITRKSRMAGDFKDEIRSDISPETGLLTEASKRTFRSPIQMEVDERGRIMVLDAGMTKASSPVGDSQAILPARILVWNRDPFSYQKCIPTDPAAAIPSCSFDQNGTCVGVGCFDRQCVGAECNASISIGQSNILYGFATTTGQDLDQIKPEGYHPITSFAIATQGAIKGLWAVTGRDARILRWEEVSQTSKPVVMNEPPQTPSLVDDQKTSTGIFSGITIDQIGGFVVAWDMKKNIGISWYGDTPGVNVDGGPAKGKIINISNEEKVEQK